MIDQNDKALRIAEEASAEEKRPDVLSRRAFLERAVALGAAGLGGTTILAACGGGEGGEAEGSEYPVVEAASCQGYDAIDEQARSAREALNYQDETPEEGQYCGNCLFKQDYPQSDRCLGCQLFAGPVSPGGWCQSWAEIQA